MRNELRRFLTFQIRGGRETPQNSLTWGANSNLARSTIPSYAITSSLYTSRDVILLATPSYSDEIKLKSLLLEYGALENVS